MSRILIQTILLLLLSITAAHATIPPAPVPQTGQITCYDAAGTVITCADSGQDGESQAGLFWPTPRFVDNGDQTQADKLTGLIWSKNANPAGATKTWQEALDYIKTLNSSNYLGYNDWRLPNVNEIKSLVNHGQASSASWLNGQGFLSVQPSQYWSSSTYAYANSKTNAWNVYMSISNGYVSSSNKTSNYYVWPVRTDQSGSFGYIQKTGQTTCYDSSGVTIICNGTGQDGELQVGTSWPAPRFTANTDLTVTDNLTGLVWSENANPAGAAKTWQGALDYIKTINASSYLGYNDWRLPNRAELESLVNSAERSYAVMLNGLVFSSVQDGSYWASTSNPSSTGLAWIISMGAGYTTNAGKAVYSYVWPVRSSEQWAVIESLIIIAPTNFGTVLTNTPPKALDIEIGNRGTTSQSITSIEITGTNAANFSISVGGSKPCSGLNPTLAAGESCTLSVATTSTTISTKSANLIVTANGISTAISLSATYNDPTSPIITDFVIPVTTTNQRTIPISNITATDNLGVKGYLITESATPPSASATGWSTTVPTNYTFVTFISGSKILYAWSKDDAGNISPPLSKTIIIDAVVPTVTAFTMSQNISSLTVLVGAFSASDSFGGVTGYLITETGTPPLPDNSGWSATAPTSYTFNSAGSKTLDAWAKDEAGNVSVPATATVTICSATASSDANGTITLPGTTIYSCNQNRLYKISPKPGYKIADVLVDGISIGATNHYLFTNVIGDHTISASFAADGNANWSAMSAGNNHSAAIRSDGTLWSWGTNDVGQVGDGSQTNRTNPVQVGNKTIWDSVSSGNRFTLGHRTDGTLWSWGNNSYGQLGDSTIIGKIIPQQVGLLTTWSNVAAGGLTDNYPIGITNPAFPGHSAALKSDGTLQSWGYNLYGEVGNNVTTNATSPVTTGTSGIQYVDISAGANHTVSLRTDGTLWGWGRNDWGQLGVASQLDKKAPVQIGTAADWIAIAAGYEHTLAIKNDGSLWGWGHNDQGQLGVETPAFSTTPILIDNSAIYTAIATGGYHSLAIRNDGTLWGFGRNLEGQLGDGTGATKSYPIQVGFDSDWLAIEAGEYHTLALKTNGTMWSWGGNSGGQLGDTTTSDRLTPVMIGTNTNNFLIRSSATSGGNITPLGNTTVAAGTSKAYTMAPLVGYQISDVKIDGVSQGVISNYTFSNVTGNHTIDAIFTNTVTTTYTVTALAGSGGSITPPGTITVNSGTSQIFAIVPLGGYTIANVVVDGASQGAITSYSFSNITSNHNISATFAIIADTTLPTISAFSIPASSNSLSVSVNLTASDNSGTISSYCLTETNNSSGCIWTVQKPTTYSFGNVGSRTLYAFVKDPTANISTSSSAITAITLLDGTQPTVTAFTLPATSSSLTVTIESLTATDNIAVSGYLFTESATPPALNDSGWSNTKPASYTFSGITDSIATVVSLYAWVKDSAGNVSGSFPSATITITLPDVTKPTITSFILPVNATSLNVPVSSFTATDNTFVTGYLITNSNTVPAAMDLRWSLNPPATYSFLTTGQKTLYAWVKDTANNISDSTSFAFTINAPVSRNIPKILAGQKSFTIDSSGILRGWGNGIVSPIVVPGNIKWHDVAGSYFDYRGINSNGGLCELNSFPNADVCNTIDTWTQLDAGYYVSGGVKEDGSLWTWGSVGGGDGAYGNGTTDSSFIPVRVGADSDWFKIAYGSRHALALKTDGSLWAWGANTNGQLGDGTTDNRLAPIRIGFDSDWIEVEAGEDNSLALKADGTMWEWGDIVNTSPARVGNGNNWADISAGYQHNAAIKNDGTLWTWGRNYFGELGSGNNDWFSEPTQAGSDSDWVRATAGMDFSLGLKANGSLFAWGRNDFGQLGDNSTTNRLSPVSIMSLGSNITINDGSNFTNSPAVNLWLSNFRGWLKMQFSIDGTNWGAEEQYSPSKVWNYATGDGVKTIFVRYLNAVGQLSQSFSASVTLDTTLPDVTIILQPSTLTNSTSGQFTFISSNDASFECKLDTGNYASCTSPFNFTNLADGIHTFTAVAKDLAGNYSAVPAVITWNIDATIPVITAFSVPYAASSLNVPISNFIASDNVTISGYLLTETETVPLPTDQGWTSTVPSSFTFSSAGNKTIYAFVKDATSNVSTSLSAPVTITLNDVTAPILTSFVLPAKASTLQVPISALTATDNVAVSAYILTETSATPSTNVIGWSSTKPNSYTFTSVGAKTLYVWAKDGADNVSSSLNATVTIDTAGPTLILSTLADGAVTNNATLNVAGTVSDLSGVLNLTVNSAAATVFNNSFSYPVNLQTGDNILTVTATDILGNISTETRVITLDQTAPTLAVSAPADNSKTAHSTATISGTINETSTVSIVVNSGTPQSAAMTGTNYNSTINLISGLNSITITATDLANNTSSAVRSVTYDDTKPSLAITVPNQDITINQNRITISGTVSDTLTATTVSISFNNQTYKPAVTNGTFSQLLTIPTEGTFAIIATATDEVGNSSSATRNVIYAAQVNGVCGSSSGKTETIAPTTNLCSVGTATTVSAFSPWNWSCTGSNSGTTASCSAESARSATSEGATEPTIADALKVFQAVVGLTTLTPEEQIRYDVAPLGSTGTPLGNGVVDGADVILILRRSIGIGSW